MTRLGLDVDGVLANFNAGFVQVLRAVSGRALCPDDYDPVVWDWPQHVGYTDEEVSEAWEAVKAVTAFWSQLPPLPGALDFLGKVQAWTQASPTRELYFITARPGNYVKQQSEWWLRRAGITNPTVLVTGDKAGACAALRLTHYVDDCFKNFSNFPVACPQTRAILRLATYNETLVDPNDNRLTLITNLSELWSIIPCEQTN